MMIRFALPLIAFATAACAPQEPPAPPPPAPAGKCSVAGLDGLIGKQRSDDVGREARARSGAARLRWIAPGTIVTMDYREDRLNLHTDESGRITEARCG